MGQQGPVDPLSDPTVKTFADTVSANGALQKQTRLTLIAILNAVLSGDTATANERFLALSPLTQAGANNQSFFKSLGGQITAAQNAVGRGDNSNPAVLSLQSSIGGQVSVVQDQQAQLQTVLSKTATLAPDPAAVTTALGKIHGNATGDTNPFWAQLPTLQAQAAAAVAALVAQSAVQAPA